MVVFDDLKDKKEKIAVVGLGYVGLPLAVHLAKHFSVIGFDVKQERIEELQNYHDINLEVTDDELKLSSIVFSKQADELSDCKLIIVAVPTPIDEYKIPDLSFIKKSCELVGKRLSKGSCVVYESTVYPGVTEEVCRQILEKESGLTFGKDFTLGYSPERINPGDTIHTIDKVTKVVSGSDEATVSLLAATYGLVVKAGIHKTTSIRVAEAAKVIENTQRDLNIALMNELSKIFNYMGINTIEVLEAAGSKWNFLPFRPGLVGGHCIGVDPYYLTFKAEAAGYNPEIILAGRRINDGMGKYVAEKTIKMLIAARKQVSDSTVAVLGFTFKENVPDLRNTKVIDIIRELKDYEVNVIASDPYADPEEARKYYDIALEKLDAIKNVDAVIIAVAHDQFKNMGIKAIADMCVSQQPILIDIKALYSPIEAQNHTMSYWGL